MEIFLCGGGSGKQISQAMKKYSKSIDKSKPILYIPLAMNSYKYDDCYNWFKKEIENVNLCDFEMVRSSQELSEKDFKDYSSLFIGGGNTYSLLYKLSEYKNLEKVANYIEEDGIIFGGSAGAIIFGKNIDVCKMEDKEEVQIKNKNGFNLLNDFSILCHFNEDNLKKNESYLFEYAKNNNIVYLPEEDVIHIKNNNIELIGEKDYIIYINGQKRYANRNQFKKYIKNK